MSADDIMTVIKARVKAEFAECNSRAYTVPSKVSYLILGASYKTPAVAIIFAGSRLIDLKGTSTKLWEHGFDLHIFQSIWKEDEVTLGGSDKTGLLKLCKSLMDDFKDYIFSTELPSNEINSATITEQYGTEDFVGIGGPLYSASIGFHIKYMEEE